MRRLILTASLLNAAFGAGVLPYSRHASAVASDSPSNPPARTELVSPKAGSPRTKVQPSVLIVRNVAYQDRASEVPPAPAAPVAQVPSSTGSSNARPLQALDSFVDRSRDEAIEAIDELSKKTRELEDQLAESKAALARWKKLLEALDQQRSAKGITGAPHTEVIPAAPTPPLSNPDGPQSMPRVIPAPEPGTLVLPAPRS